MMKVYAAQHSSCCYESSPETLSVHKTSEGAEKVLAKHRKKMQKTYKDKDLDMHIFRVVEFDVLP